MSVRRCSQETRRDSRNGPRVCSHESDVTARGGEPVPHWDALVIGRYAHVEIQNPRRVTECKDAEFNKAKLLQGDGTQTTRVRYRMPSAMPNAAIFVTSAPCSTALLNTVVFTRAWTLQTLNGIAMKDPSCVDIRMSASTSVQFGQLAIEGSQLASIIDNQALNRCHEPV